MSVQSVRTALREFLLGPMGRSLVLTGRWGVGKTFTWNRIRYEVAKQKALPVYSYVSLFGMGDIQAVKTAIFLNAIAPAPDTPTNIKDAARTALDGLKKRVAPFLKAIPVLKDADTATLMSWAVRKNLICIDDLERRNPSLRLADIMGLVSYLKEECDCQVLVIANDEEFGEEKAHFRIHFEKVFDVAILLEPTPQEAASFVEGASRGAQMARQVTIALGVTNARLIGKIIALANQIDADLESSADPVVEEVIRSLVVIARSYFESPGAPPLDFLDRRRGDLAFDLVDAQREKTSQEIDWNSTLQAVGFDGFGETEHLLCAALARGYFDPAALRELCVEANANHERNLLRQPFYAIVNELDCRWGGQIAHFLPRLEAAISEAGVALYLGDIALACQMFNRLARRDLADKHASQYLAQVPPDDDSLFFGVERYPEPLRALIHQHRRERADTRPLIEVISGLPREPLEHNSFERLARATPEEIAAAFRSYSGNFSVLFVEFERAGVNDVVYQRAIAALRILADESDLNAVRAQPFLRNHDTRVARAPLGPDPQMDI